MNNQVVKVKGIPMELGGTDYIVPPLSLGALEQLLPRITSFKANPSDVADIKVVVDAAHAALKRNYPDIERSVIADAIGLENMMDVMDTIMDISGLKRKAKEAEQMGEA
jgi:hypothetical protein